MPYYCQVYWLGWKVWSGSKIMIYIQVGSKRKREYDSDDMSRGAARAHEFLKEFSNLPLETMDLKEALQKVSKMKDDLQKDSVNSHWLQQFF